MDNDNYFLSSARISSRDQASDQFESPGMKGNDIDNGDSEDEDVKDRDDNESDDTSPVRTSERLKTRKPGRKKDDITKTVGRSTSTRSQSTTRTRKRQTSIKSESPEESTMIAAFEKPKPIKDETGDTQTISETNGLDGVPAPVFHARKRRGLIPDKDKEAVWIILQSKYDPLEKRLPHGIIERTAKQFDISKCTIKSVWRRGIESIKKQQEELLGVKGIDDHTALTTLTVGGKIIRPDVKSRGVSNSRKP